MDSNTPLSSMLVNDRIMDRVQQYDTGDIDNYVGSEVSGPPFRPAAYFQRMDGMHVWQTWANLEYPPEYRLQVTKGAIAETMQISVLNNQPEPIQFAAIAIQDYALNTQMVYTGQGEV